jgi:hypothetical protein
VAEHFQIDEFHERCGFLVHVLTPNFFATFLEGELDVFTLIALVGAQAADELVDVFFEHGYGCGCCCQVSAEEEWAFGGGRLSTSVRCSSMLLPRLGKRRAGDDDSSHMSFSMCSSGSSSGT